MPLSVCALGQAGVGAAECRRLVDPEPARLCCAKRALLKRRSPVSVFTLYCYLIRAEPFIGAYFRPEPVSLTRFDSNFKQVGENGWRDRIAEATAAKDAAVEDAAKVLGGRDIDAFLGDYDNRLVGKFDAAPPRASTTGGTCVSRCAACCNPQGSEAVK